MAEGNGDAPQNGAIDSVDTAKDHTTLVDLGFDKGVASKLCEIYGTGKLAHADLDDRALDGLREFDREGALAVLTQFQEANLSHISNKSAYLCGVMKSYRQKLKSPGEDLSPVNDGPDEDKIRTLLDRTGYTLDITTGQRKYGGPPPNWEGKPPGNGCEIFCGKIPKDIFEDELIPLFENCGDIWDLRLMMDPMTSRNRGYAFVTFTSCEGASEAVKQMDGYEIRPNRSLKVNISVPNLRLFVGNIPKSKDKADIMEEFAKWTDDLCDVIIYSSPDDNKKNRGFCFLEYESHKAASLAKRRLSSGRARAWNCEIIVDWADPQEEPNSEVMSKVKVLYARNLTQECTEDKLRDTFEQFGAIERVKKIKDYAFIHFVERAEAVKAMESLHQTELCGSCIDVSLAKPPSDKRKKEEILRNRERRMYGMMTHRGFKYVQPGFHRLPHEFHRQPFMHPGCFARGPLMGLPSMGRGDYGVAGGVYDHDYEVYGCTDFRTPYNGLFYNGFYGEDFYGAGAGAGMPDVGRGRGRSSVGGRGRGSRGRASVPGARAPEGSQDASDC